MRSSTIASAATFGAVVSALTLPPLPSLSLPSLSLPSISIPTALPSVSLPGVDLPSLTLPSISTPSVSLPGVDLPSLTLPSISIPTALPSVSIPIVSIPSVTLPSVTTPSVPVSTSLPGVQLPGGFSALITALQELISLLSNPPSSVLSTFAKVDQILQSLASSISAVNSSTGSVPKLPDGGAAFVEQVEDNVSPQLQKVVAQSKALPFPLSLLRSQFQSQVNTIATALIRALNAVPRTTSVDPQLAIDRLNAVIKANNGVATRSEGAAVVPMEFTA